MSHMIQSHDLTHIYLVPILNQWHLKSHMSTYTQMCFVMIRTLSQMRTSTKSLKKVYICISVVRVSLGVTVEHGGGGGGERKKL